MTVLVAPLYTLLAGDPNLTARLSTYNGSPAVFSNQKVPADASAPYVVISPSVTDNSFDALKEFGRDIVHDIWIVFPEKGSVSDLDSAAERVRTLLHKTSLTVSGFQHVQSFASGPTVAPIEGGRSGFQQDEVDEVGRLVTVRVLLRQL
jgi:hypothetical protein